MTGYMDDGYARWLINNQSPFYRCSQIDNNRWLVVHRNNEDMKPFVIRRFQEMGKPSEWGYDYIDKKEAPL